MHDPLLSSWPRIVSEGVYADAFDPAVRMSYADYQDVAEVAAISFTEDRLVRGTFELSAPGDCTAHDIADQLGSVPLASASARR